MFLSGYHGFRIRDYRDFAAYLIGLGKAQSYDTHNFIIPYSLNQGEDI